MPYELIHDTIARQVFDKASVEARTRRKVERYVREHYQDYKVRGVKLTQDDVDYIQPYLASINIEREELVWIEKAKAGLKRARRRRRVIIALIIAILSVTSIAAIIQGQRANQAAKAAEADRQMALEERIKADEQRVLADSMRLEADSALVKQIDAQIEAELQAEQATAAAARAERDRQRAVLAQQEAEAAGDRARIARQRADELAEAEIEARDEARRQAAQAVEEKNRAEAFEQQAVRQANTSRLSAIALQQATVNPTIALRLAYEACKVSGFADELAVTTYHQLIDDPQNCFYQLDFAEHESQLLSTAMSKDKKYVLSGDASGQLLYWQISDGSILGRWDSEQRGVRAIDFLGDGTTALTAHESGKVIIWDLAENNMLRSFDLGGPVKVACFLPQEQAVLALGEGGQTRKWQLRTGIPLSCAIRHRATIWSMDRSRNGQFLLTGDDSGLLKLWAGSGEKAINSKSIGNASIRGVAIAPDGKSVVVGDVEGNLRLYSLPRLKLLAEWETNGSPILKLAHVPKGNRVVSSDASGNILLWDTSTGQPVSRLKGHEKSAIALHFSQDGDYFLTGGADRRCLVWNTALWQRQLKLREGSQFTTKVAYTPDGKAVLTGGYDRKVRTWRHEGPSSHRKINTYEGHSEFGAIIALGMIPQSNLSMSGDHDGKVILRDWQTQETVANFAVATDPADAIAFSHDGQLIAVSHNDGTIELWDVATRKSLGKMASQHEYRIFCMVFSADDQTLYSGDLLGGLMKWDVPTRNLLQDLSGPESRIRSMAVNPAGTVLMVGYDSGQMLSYTFDDEGKSETYTINDTGVYSLDFSPDGQQLFVGHNGTKAELRDMATMEVRQQYTFPSNPREVRPYAADFFPLNGKEILIGGGDGNSWIIQNVCYALEGGKSIAPLPKPLDFYTN